MKSTKTNASVWTRIFRAIVARVEQDPDINRVVGAANVRSWSGKPGDSSPMVPTGDAPILRLTPNPGNVSWYDPSSQIGTLSVAVELAVQSTCVDDVADTWDLVVIALNPGDHVFTQHLIALGAETGEIVFTSPAFDPGPESEPQGFFAAHGSFNLAIVRSIAP